MLEADRLVIYAASEDEMNKILAEEAERDFDGLELVYPKEVPVFEKYDECKGHVKAVLDAAME